MPKDISIGFAEDEKTDPNLVIQKIPDDERTDPNLVVNRAAASASSGIVDFGFDTGTAEAPAPAPAPEDSALFPPTSPEEEALLPPEIPEDATKKPKMPELGPLAALFEDPDITEIMVNDLRNVMVERRGKLMYAGFRFETIDEINRIARNILDVTGRILSVDAPYVDVMLPDGSRVNIVAPPLTTTGPCITIRKFPKQYSMDELITMGTLDARVARFLQACVAGRLNVLVCGGTGSGKTTFLNALTSFIPKSERIVTIEDTPELRLAHPNHVRMQTKPQMPGSPPITARELVANALRMRPDRIIVGECRREEALDMLQAMNTGHAGSMTTIHANTPRDGLSRLETLCLMSGVELPLAALRKQITSALDLIVQLRRMRSGRRRLVEVTEITGLETNTITLQDIYVFQPDRDATPEEDRGILKPTGLVPSFVERLEGAGVQIPRDLFS